MNQNQCVQGSQANKNEKNFIQFKGFDLVHFLDENVGVTGPSITGNRPNETLSFGKFHRKWMIDKQGS
jgi:hypothetical protein